MTDYTFVKFNGSMMTFANKSGKSTKRIKLNIDNEEEFLSALGAVPVEAITEDMLVGLEKIIDDYADRLNSVQYRFDTTKYYSAVHMKEKLVKDYIEYNLTQKGQGYINFEDVYVIVDKDTGYIYDITGDFCPGEYATEVGYFGLPEEQKLGFLKSLPARFIDDKLLSYIAEVDECLVVHKELFFDNKTIEEYRKIKPKVYMDEVLRALKTKNPDIYEFVIKFVLQNKKIEDLSK